ncbi:MAG: serine O-acetyltransferase [Verrucomicrobiae bacterium]|nr:serine O-acetyltransferase [Verrucomicrobiae bacterium]
MAEADQGPITQPGTEDPVWARVRAETERMARAEPTMSSFLYNTILRHRTLESVLAYHLASKLECDAFDDKLLMELFADAMAADPEIGASARADIRAVSDRDPAAAGYAPTLLFFKGFQAIQAHRIAHWYWGQGRRSLAMFFQSRVSEVFGVDIHPAARIGRGILLDHASSFVAGETAVIEDDVSILHEVTLGGTGKEHGDRHPKVRRGVLIGAGAKILGNVEIGACAKIGAGSVVLADVPPHCTVVGVPAKVVGHPCEQLPALAMDHKIQADEGR